MSTRPIRAVEMMRTLRRRLDRRYKGLSLAERVHRMKEEVHSPPAPRRASHQRRAGRRTATK